MSPRRPFSPSRRHILQGLLGGAAVSVGLPSLAAFAPSTARAQESSFPLRFGMFFWGNGVLPDRWVPTETGADWTVTPQLEPLAAFKDQFTLVSGHEIKIPNRIAHFTGPAGLLSGMPGSGDDESASFNGPSLDQVIAQAIGGDTPFRSLEIGAQPDCRGMSFNGSDSRNPPVSDPLALYERLFGATFREPGQGGVVDPRLGLRRSALDAVMADISALQARVGVEDKVRLDQHFTSVRELELRIARLQEDPPDYAACSRPEAPVMPSDTATRPDMEARSKLNAEMLAMAMACDLTRVGSFWYSDPLNNTLYPDATAGHHQLTHDEPGDQPQVHEIVLSAMRSFADLLTALSNVPEGDGTLLDHMALLGTTDVSYGRTHQIDEFPMILAGRAGGKLKVGEHVRSATPENAGRIPLTLMRTMGLAAASYGQDEAFTEDGLSEVEA